MKHTEHILWADDSDDYLPSSCITYDKPTRIESGVFMPPNNHNTYDDEEECADLTTYLLVNKWTIHKIFFQPNEGNFSIKIIASRVRPE